MTANFSNSSNSTNVLREITNQDTVEYKNSHQTFSSKSNAAYLVDSHLTVPRKIGPAAGVATQENRSSHAGEEGGANQNSPTAAKNKIKKSQNFFTSIKTLPTANNCITPLDCQFLAENCPIVIKPHFSSGNQNLELLSGQIGPIKAAHNVSVPLWVALSLKKQRKCSILKPEWMHVENLEKLKTLELESGNFQPPPHPHYRELTESILNSAADDIDSADEVRTAVKDLWDCRTSKLSILFKNFLNQEELEDNGMGELVSSGKIKNEQEMIGDFNNVTQLEISLFREPVCHAMDVKHIDGVGII